MASTPSCFCFLGAWSFLSHFSCFKKQTNTFISQRNKTAFVCLAHTLAWWWLSCKTKKTCHTNHQYEISPAGWAPTRSPALLPHHPLRHDQSSIERRWTSPEGIIASSQGLPQSPKRNLKVQNKTTKTHRSYTAMPTFGGVVGAALRRRVHQSHADESRLEQNNSSGDAAAARLSDSLVLATIQVLNIHYTTWPSTA
jgi:hypothetical protein